MLYQLSYASGQTIDSSRFLWSGRRESNPQPTAWKAVTLPLSYSRPASGRQRMPRDPQAHLPFLCPLYGKPQAVVNAERRTWMRKDPGTGSRDATRRYPPPQPEYIAPA